MLETLPPFRIILPWTTLNCASDALCYHNGLTWRIFVVLSETSLKGPLRRHGIRLTRQRELLFEIIHHSHKHLNADQLYELAKKRDPKINRVTVYRTLKLLKQEGLIDELDLLHHEGDQHYYETRLKREHAHIVCLRCGGVQEFFWGAAAVTEATNRVRLRISDSRRQDRSRRLIALIARPRRQAAAARRRKTTPTISPAQNARPARPSKCQCPRTLRPRLRQTVPTAPP